MDTMLLKYSVSIAPILPMRKLFKEGEGTYLLKVTARRSKAGCKQSVDDPRVRTALQGVPSPSPGFISPFLSLTSGGPQCQSREEP